MPYSLSSTSGRSLAPIERPHCPQCHNRMDLARIIPGPEGYDLRNFECHKCDCVTTVAVARDPMKSDAMRWLAGGLKPPA